MCASDHKPTRGTTGEGRWPILTWFASRERLVPVAELARLVTKYAERGRVFALSAKRRQDRQVMHEQRDDPE